MLPVGDALARSTSASRAVEKQTARSSFSVPFKLGSSYVDCDTLYDAVCRTSGLLLSVLSQQLHSAWANLDWCGGASLFASPGGPSPPVRHHTPCPQQLLL